MTTRSLPYIRSFAAALVVCGVSAPALWAQGPATAELPDAPAAASAVASMVSPSLSAAASPVVLPAPPLPTPSAAGEHRFWDKTNVALFTASSGLAATDFAVTRANLQAGGRELNPIVRLFGRSTAGLAANFIGEATGGVGLSYFFHKTGHHRLERMVSLVNISASAGAVSYGLSHR